MVLAMYCFELLYPFIIIKEAKHADPIHLNLSYWESN